MPELFGTTGPDTLVGTAGDDTLRSGPPADPGTDAAPDSLQGAAGNDSLRGYAGADTLLGELGFDTLNGGSGDDLLDLGFTAGAIELFNPAEKVRGGGGNDTLVGASRGISSFDQVRLSAGNGDDRLESRDTGFAQDQLKGGTGDDTLLGGAGAQRMNGGRDDDLIDAGAGLDILHGDEGEDTLSGGLGTDILEGGLGADVLRWLSPEEGNDTVVGFVSTEDRIELSAAGFGAGLVAGAALPDALFAANPGGTGGPGVLVTLDTSTGLLRFDADANGPGAPVVLALLLGTATLTAADLHIIA